MGIGAVNRRLPTVAWMLAVALAVSACGNTATGSPHGPGASADAAGARYVLAVRYPGSTTCGDGVTQLLTSSGRQVALVGRPADICNWTTVAAGVSPGRPSRTFFLQGLMTDLAHRRIYQMRIDRHGKIVKLTPVTVSADDSIDDLAVTPDGARFAFPTARPVKGGMAYGVVVADAGATGHPCGRHRHST